VAAIDPVDEVAPAMRLSTSGGMELDFSGLSEVKARLQLGAADEFTMTFAAQDMDGAWRSDMPTWQTGGTVVFEAGYNGEFDEIQTFEIASTTTTYGEDQGGETATVRAVSDLARAARYKAARAFDYAPRGYGDVRAGADSAVICKTYGWTNGVSGELLDPPKRVKENGASDLTFLKQIANEAGLGGPRLINVGVLGSSGTLIMPEPKIGDLKYLRGPSYGVSGWRRLHRISSNREGGQIATRVAITGWDPDKREFVRIDFEADEFGGDPKVVYEGAVASKEILVPSTTQGLILSVLDYRGQSKGDRIDVLSFGRYTNETNAEELAKRWFKLREKLGRWVDVTVDGHADLVPYTSIELDGDGLAPQDRGVWLPIVVNHTLNQSGWTCELRCVRVVEEAVVTPV
jgi:hypothetical protein